MTDGRIAIILREVAAARGISPAELIGQHGANIKAHAHSRNLAALLLRQCAGLSYPQIAKVMHRHYSTIMFGCRRIENLVAAGGVMAGDYAVALAGIQASLKEADTATASTEAVTRRALARQLRSLADELTSLARQVERESVCMHAGQLAKEHGARAAAAVRVALKRARAG